MKRHQSYIFIAVTTLALLTACGGNGDEPTPAGDTTTLVTTTCTPAPELPSRYALVFKSCDSAGVPQYYDKTECVRDNSTGLIWQGQTPAGTGLRANDQIKTNYDDTAKLQKHTPSSAGTIIVAPTPADVNAITNSIGFKNAVNATNLCGYGNWRMPTNDELLSLVKRDEYLLIDNAWFPNMPAYGWYWSSTPTPGYDHSGWTVDFNGGFPVTSARIAGGRNLVRLVH